MLHSFFNILIKYSRKSVESMLKCFKKWRYGILVAQISCVNIVLCRVSVVAVDGLECEPLPFLVSHSLQIAGYQRSWRRHRGIGISHFLKLTSTKIKSLQGSN